MDADGSNVQQTTFLGGENAYPSWSPDGTRLVFNHANVSGGNYDIYMINVNGKGLTQLTNGPSDDFYPSWSPNGDEITFDRCGSGCSVLALNLVSGKWRSVAFAADRSFFSDVAPDGTRFAYATYPEGDLHVRSMTKGMGYFVLNGDGIVYPDWSPNGRFLLYTWGGGGIGFVTAEEDGVVPPAYPAIYPGMDYVEDPDWQPVCSVMGTGEADVLEGSSRSELLCGLGGGDTIRGGGGFDLLLGGPGNDRLYGDAARDALVGGSGADRHFGGAAMDFLWARDGVTGNDRLDGGDDGYKDVCYKDRDDVAINC
jgi:Ca2+-binding RTX toxin-like protein